MVHTKDGSRLVREFIARGSAKDRKQVVKAIKPYVERMSREELAQLVLFSAFDIIDDTKLVSKSLVSELTAAAPAIWKSIHGRRSLLYLVAPRSRRHFTPAQIATLAETDAIKAQTSKKDDSVRAAEIRKAASEPLLEFVARHGKEVVLDTGGSLLVLEIMLQTDGDQSAATKTLLELIAAPYPAPSHPIDSSHVARLYKTLLQGGHFDQSSKSITEPSSAFSPSNFASAFMVTVDPDVTVAIAGGSGAFVVAELCSRVGAEGTGAEKGRLRTWFTEGGFRECNLGKGLKGRNVLLESIDSLLST
jgi:pumilio family protein 6